MIVQENIEMSTSTKVDMVKIKNIEVKKKAHHQEKEDLLLLTLMIHSILSLAKVIEAVAEARIHHPNQAVSAIDLFMN